MNPNEKPQKTFYHKDQEQNLLAVKHSLKQNRRAYMPRKNKSVSITYFGGLFYITFELIKEHNCLGQMMDFVTPDMNILRFNSFARKGRQFVDAMNDYRLLRTLPSNFMENVLDKLHIRDGYVIDVLEYGDGYGRECRFYAHKAATNGIYKGDYDGTQGLFSSLFSGEPRRTIEKYSDDMEIYGYLSREAEKKIPDVQEYLSYPFTKEAVWQLYLLDIADTILPLFWHGGYHKRTFFFDRQSFLTFEHKEVASFAHSKDIIPKVEITGENTMVVKCCFWSEWHGLCVEEVIAECTDGKVTFSRDQSRLKILFPHNSSLRF